MELNGWGDGEKMGFEERGRRKEEDESSLPRREMSTFLLVLYDLPSLRGLLSRVYWSDLHLCASPSSLS